MSLIAKLEFEHPHDRIEEKLNEMSTECSQADGSDGGFQVDSQMPHPEAVINIAKWLINSHAKFVHIN